MSRDAATRTPFLLVPGQAGHHIPFIPVDRVGFEPDNLLLAGQALYQLELAAHVADDPAMPAGNGRDRRRARHWLAALDVSRYGILKLRSHSPRRVVIRRGGRTRTRVAQFWRLPFWPLNYAPKK